MQTYDVIVLGAGGVGSAALAELARRGVRAVGIDRFHPPHDRGSTHGQTRVIRQAYFEHSDYVPLLKESYRLWRELEQRTGAATVPRSRAARSRTGGRRGGAGRVAGGQGALPGS